MAVIAAQESWGRGEVGSRKRERDIFLNENYSACLQVDVQIFEDSKICREGRRKMEERAHGSQSDTHRHARTGTHTHTHTHTHTVGPV